jgi:hypothetical protein
LKETQEMTKRKLIYLLVLALFVAGCGSDQVDSIDSVDADVIVFRPPT